MFLPVTLDLQYLERYGMNGDNNRDRMQTASSCPCDHCDSRGEFLCCRRKPAENAHTCHKIARWGTHRMRWVETDAARIGPQQPTEDVVVAWLTA